MVRFDGYSATTLEANHYQLAELFGPGLEVREGRGFHHFGHRAEFRDEGGHSVGAVQWGGPMGDRAMLEVKGERTSEVVERLRSLFHHRVTRMDSCGDFDGPGSFKRLLGACMRVKRAHRLIGRRDGDWQSYPELGRTQYIGSPQSVAMVRLYEKGRQPEYRHLARPDWCRLEIQVRPDKVVKEAYASVSPIGAWGASAWSRELAGVVLAGHVDPHPAGSTWRASERDRAISWMCRQYGSHLLSLREDLGDWQSVGLTLSEVIAANAAQGGKGA